MPVETKKERMTKNNLVTIPTDETEQNRIDNIIQSNIVASPK